MPCSDRDSCVLKKKKEKKINEDIILREEMKRERKKMKKRRITRFAEKMRKIISIYVEGVRRKNLMIVHHMGYRLTIISTYIMII